MKQKWEPLTFICRDCGTKIKSEYPGHFSVCGCPKEDYIFIDQTEYYIRLGGKPEKFIKVE